MASQRNLFKKKAEKKELTPEVAAAEAVSQLKKARELCKMSKDSGKIIRDLIEKSNTDIGVEAEALIEQQLTDAVEQMKALAEEILSSRLSVVAPMLLMIGTIYFIRFDKNTVLINKICHYIKRVAGQWEETHSYGKSVGGPRPVPRVPGGHQAHEESVRVRGGRVQTRRNCMYYLTVYEDNVTCQIKMLCLGTVCRPVLRRRHGQLDLCARAARQRDG